MTKCISADLGACLHSRSCQDETVVVVVEVPCRAKYKALLLTQR